MLTGFVYKLLKRFFSSKYTKSIIKGSGITLFIIVLTNLLYLVFLALKTRYILPADLGLYMLATSIVTTFTVFSYGFNSGIQRYAAIFNKEGRLKKIYFKVLFYSLIFCFVFLVVIFCFSGLIVDFFAAFNSDIKNSTDCLIDLVRILSLALCFQIIYLINASMLRSRFFIYYGHLFQLAVAFFSLLALIIFKKYFDLLYLLAVSFAIINFLIMVYSFIVIKQKLPFVFDKKIKITEDKSRILLFSGLSSLTGIFGKYVLEINTMIIAMFLGAKEIALYGIATRVSMLPNFFLQANDNISGPLLAKLYGNKDYVSIKALVKRIILFLFFISGVFFIGLFLFADFLLAIFGDFYLQAKWPLLIMTFAQIFNTSIGAGINVINAVGKPHYNTITQILFLFFLAVASLILIPLYGLIGGAIAFAGGTIFINLIRLYQVFLCLRGK